MLLEYATGESVVAAGAGGAGRVKQDATEEDLLP